MLLDYFGFELKRILSQLWKCKVCTEIQFFFFILMTESGLGWLLFYM